MSDTEALLAVSGRGNREQFERRPLLGRPQLCHRAPEPWGLAERRYVVSYDHVNTSSLPLHFARDVARAPTAGPLRTKVFGTPFRTPSHDTTARTPAPNRHFTDPPFGVFVTAQLVGVFLLVRFWVGKLPSGFCAPA